MHNLFCEIFKFHVNIGENTCEEIPKNPSSPKKL